MPTISINGKTISFSGSGSINISGNKITVGGVDISDLSTVDEKVINITIEGSVEDLSVENGEVEVKGDVRELNSKNGNIQCGNVEGNVESKNGNISCGRVAGNVHSKNGNISHR